MRKNKMLSRKQNQVQEAQRRHAVEEDESVTDIYTTDGTVVSALATPSPPQRGDHRLFREISVGGPVDNDANSVLTDHDIFRATCEAEERRIMNDFTFDYSVNSERSFDADHVGGDDEPHHGQAMSVMSLAEAEAASTSLPSTTNGNGTTSNNGVWAPLPLAVSSVSATRADTTVVSMDNMEDGDGAPNNNTLDSSNSTGPKQQQQQQQSGISFMDKIRTLRPSTVKTKPSSDPTLISNNSASISPASASPISDYVQDRYDDNLIIGVFTPTTAPASPARKSPPRQASNNTLPPAVIVVGGNNQNHLNNSSYNNNNNNNMNDSYRNNAGVVAVPPPSNSKGFNCVTWTRNLWGDWVGRAIIVCMLVIILAVGVSVGSLLVSGLAQNNNEASASSEQQTGSTAMPSPAPAKLAPAPLPAPGAPTVDDTPNGPVRWKPTATTPPPPTATPSLRPTALRAPSMTPSKPPVVQFVRPTDSPTKPPEASPPPPPPPTDDTITSSCEDSTTATFFVDNVGLQNCEWLSTDPTQQQLLCLDRLQPFTSCPKTCNSCPEEDDPPAASPVAAPAPAPTIASPAPSTVITTTTMAPSLGAVTAVPTLQPQAAADGVPTTRSTILAALPPGTVAQIEENDDSAAAKALAWLETATSVVVPDEEQLLVQRFVMATLAYSAESDQWSTSTSWLDANASECEWYGVQCSNNDGMVTSINLRGNNVSGRLAPEIVLLADSLEQIDLGENELRGDIPREIGQLTRLESLLLDTNRLEGRLPESVGEMPSLTSLAFQYNSMTGSVPSSLAQLTNLQQLTFWNNELTGTVPEEVCRFSGMSELILDCLEIECDCWTRCYYQCGGNTGIECRGDGGGPPNL